MDFFGDFIADTYELQIVGNAFYESSIVAVEALASDPFDIFADGVNFGFDFTFSLLEAGTSNVFDSFTLTQADDASTGGPNGRMWFGSQTDSATPGNPDPIDPANPNNFFLVGFDFSAFLEGFGAGVFADLDPLFGAVDFQFGGAQGSGLDGFFVSDGNFDTLFEGSFGLPEFAPGQGVPPIPEPSTVVLLGAGLAGLAGAHLRRRKK